MMTDAMKPLGISVWQLTAAVPMHPAGGRLFVDVSHHLASPANRDRLVAGFGKSDPLTGDALHTIVERDFIPLVPDDGPVPRFLAPPTRSRSIRRSSTSSSPPTGRRSQPCGATSSRRPDRR
jgi:hypothetical protein